MSSLKLIVIGGIPAAGKTSIAQKLSEKAGLTYISRDRIKEAVFDAAGWKDREWSKEIGKISWPMFQRIVEMYLERGESVIAESTFTWPSDADWLHDLAQRTGAELIQIWISTDPKVAKQRFVDRANDDRHCGHCDALEDVIDEFSRMYFSGTFIPLPLEGKTKVVDTTKSFPDENDLMDFIS